MGKPIIAQKRGKGSPTYKAPSHNFKGKVMVLNKERAVIQDLIKCRAHTAPLAVLKYHDDSFSLAIAPTNVRVGDEIVIGEGAEVKNGNVIALKDLPLGTSVFNIELQPGDGGKFVRGTGSTAKVVAKTASGVKVQLPSKKLKTFHPNCKAMIGTVAGGGRLEKPLVKAGNRYYKMKARNKIWPIVSANSMGPVDHPFGNTRSSRKSKSTPAPKNAPPGRKVGAISPKKTGRGR